MLMSNVGDRMTNLGSVKELSIGAPIPVRIMKNALPGRIEFFFGMPEKKMNADKTMSYRSLEMITRKTLGGSINATLLDGVTGGVFAEIHGKGGNKHAAYSLHRDIGSLYLSNLDFSGVEKLEIRAYECLGTPVGYVGDGSRLALGLQMGVVKAIMHHDPIINKIILDDLKILLGNRVGDSSHGNYFQGEFFGSGYVSLVAKGSIEL